MEFVRAVLLVDLAVLCLGVGIILVALLSWERSGMRWLRDLAFVLAGASFLLMADIFRIYGITANWPSGPNGRLVLAVLTGTGNFALVTTVPVFVRGIVPMPLHRIRRVLGWAGMVLFPIAGVLDELFDTQALHVINDIGMASLLLAAAVVLAIGYRGITEPETRRMVNRMMWLTVGTIILGRGQLLLTSVIGVEVGLRRIRVVQVLYFLGLLVVLLVFAIRHLFRAEGAANPVLPQEFVERFRVSNREREIISLIMQGYPNRTIGERLFISDRTVKNHISSIYRKTGAANKVQLLNMVRNHPGA